MSMAEVKFQKPSVVLWLLILGKNLATQIHPLVLNCPASCQSLSSPIKRLTELITPHFPCTATSQNACSQSPSPCRHQGATKGTALVRTAFLWAAMPDSFSSWQIQGSAEHSAPLHAPGSFTQRLSGSQNLTLGMGTDFLKCFF